MRTLTCSTLSLALLFAVGCGDDSTMMMMPMETPLNEKLVGTWNSMGCESALSLMGYSLFAKRSYKFTTSTEFQITADLYAEQNCAFKLLTVDAKGTFKIGPEVTAVAGAKEADFMIAQRGATAFLPMAKDLLNMISCGGNANWMVGVRQDISASGCDPVVPSVASCPKESDLALLSDASTLKLGTRPMTSTGICTSRPTTLGLPLLKQ